MLGQIETAEIRVKSHTINKGNHDDKVIIGYGNVSEEEIQEGVQRLTSLLV
ncbi:hypothetical protein [Brevibacillus choshinensis]|uniref:hypothetical protein n=1 Tax=Brevibacillus choshinensis TaxID=54911 RepID=UPI002E22AE5D|nr:hypothetical protein [Brevibacillus choshinensis]